MAACYNTILVPSAERETIFAAIADALHLLGYRVVHREEPSSYSDGFQYYSVEMIFGGPPGDSPWVPLSSWGDGMLCKFPQWYRMNPLAMALSYTVSPVIYLFTHDAGLVAGYSIFKGGQQVEAMSLMDQVEWPLGEFAPALPMPATPTNLGAILGDATFDFEGFMRGFQCLEVATAALAARLGASVHLIDALAVQDGDGAFVVRNGEYKQVSLPGWFGVYYEKAAP
jgi:hypothetical protein